MKISRKFGAFLTIASILSASVAAANAQEQTSPASQDEINKAIEHLKSAPILPEQTHNPNAHHIDGLEKRSRNYSAIVLPVSALQVPEVAQSFDAVARDPETKVAIEGYDPVGYFTKNEAIKGTPEFTAEYNGVVYLFESAENRDLFLNSSDKYAPAYGGYCTQTLASGSLTPGDPTSWTIHGDRLYFTRSPESTKSFRERRALNVASADAFWNQVDASLNTPNAGYQESAL